MPITGVSVEKTTLFRGAQQPFANIYYYYSDLGLPNELWAQRLGDNVVAGERDLHSTDVNFVRLRVWSAGGTPAQNEMLHEKALSGTGTAPIKAELDRERAILIMWPAGKSVTGKPVYLRKWFHICGERAGAIFTPGVLANTSGLSATARTDLASAANGFGLINTVDQGYTLAAKSGRRQQGDAICHQYLEHRQLGDAWRT